MRRKLIGMIWTATVVTLLVRRFAPGAWSHAERLVRARVASLRWPARAPQHDDMAPAEVGLVPDPAAPTMQLDEVATVVEIGASVLGSRR